MRTGPGRAAADAAPASPTATALPMRTRLGAAAAARAPAPPTTIRGIRPTAGPRPGTPANEPSDPVNGGRGGRASGVTDTDRGNWADPANNGRGGRRRCPTNL